MNGEIFIPIIMFASTAIVLWVYLTNRNKERMALIEKGSDMGIFKRNGNRLSTLKWGMLFVGVGVGIILGNILVINSSMNEEIAFPAMIFLFGGISLIVYYFIAGKLKQ